MWKNQKIVGEQLGNSCSRTRRSSPENEHLVRRKLLIPSNRAPDDVTSALSSFAQRSHFERKSVGAREKRSFDKPHWALQTVGTRLRLDQVGLPKRYRLRTWLETPFCNLWLNWAGEIKGNAAPTNYYRILCVLGDDVLSCLETSRWEWSPVDSSIGCFRFVCCGRLRILHDPRMGENSKRGDQIRHLRDRFSHYVHIDNCRAACLDQETG